MAENEENLKREIGVWGLSANIINIMIGAGIFVLPAIVAANLGAESILAYLFCGFLITLVMLCFAEVGSRITSSGGAYTYIEKSFGKYPGFITAMLFMLSGIASDAAVANAVTEIVSSIFPFFQGYLLKSLFAVFLFLGLAFINIIGLKKGMAFVKIIITLKVVPLLIIVLIGFKDVSVVNLYWETVPSAKKIGETALILFFAFQGAETGLLVSGEVKNPNKTIPQAIRLAVVGVLLLYILIQTISQGILGASLAAFIENPLGEVASQIFGPIGFTLITIGAAVSMFGTLSSEILSMPRLLYAASNDKVIPVKMLSQIHTKYSTPFISIIVYAGLGLIFTLAGGFRQLAIISSASTLLIYLGVSLSVIKLRTVKNLVPDVKLFRIRGGYTVPILSSLVILWFLSNLARNELLGIGSFLIILTLIYGLINFKKLRQPFQGKRN
ncbi:MAG TPA: APC family permease [Bacteroidales bacterium]